MKVQRWTGAVSAHEAGGFVAVGDYMALQAEVERVEKGLAAAKADAARYVSLQARVYKNGGDLEINIPNGYDQFGMDLRQAIDAAMKGQP